MLTELPRSPEAIHELVKHKLNEHTGQLKILAEENKVQDMALQRIEEKINSIERHTHNIVELFEAANGTVRVLKWIGGAAGWVAAIASAIGAVWYALSNFSDKG